jgi:hypothetical protein
MSYKTDPVNFPKIGDFYYHYKHNSELSINNYAYVIIGIALHSETEGLLVTYRPLYKPNHIFEYGADFNIRPLDMFLENIDKENYSGPRFNQIIDEEIIKELQLFI